MYKIRTCSLLLKKSIKGSGRLHCVIISWTTPFDLIPTGAMKVSRGYILLGLTVTPHTLASRDPRSHGLRNRTQDNILHAGIGAVRGICDPLESECASNDMHIKEDINTALRLKSKVTGEVFCVLAGYREDAAC